MKIERTWFDGVNSARKAAPIADGIPTFDFFGDGHVEIFIPTDGGPNGHAITLTREEAERLQ
jgi:hypothetical protein